VRDEQPHRLAQRLRHIASRIAIAHGHIDLDPRRDPPRRRQEPGHEREHGRARIGHEGLRGERLRIALAIIDARGVQRAQRRRHDLDAPVLGPGIERQAPALRDQRAARLRFHMHARAGDQRADQVVVVSGLDAQEGARLGERQRLDRRRGEKK
jgi:hypothetical protein